MRLIFLTMLAMLVSGCLHVTPGSLEAACDGSRQARADHAAALVREGSTPDSVVLSGQILIAVIDAGCAQ